MNRYVFLTNQYVPRPGATGLCVHRIAQELVCNNQNVDVICFWGDDSLGREVIIDGVNIHRIKQPSFFSSESSIVLARISLIAKLIHINKYPLRSMLLVKKYLSVLNNIYNEKDDFIVISTYTPIEAEYAVMIFKRKHPRIRTIFYSTDTLSNEEGKGLLPVSFRRKKGLEWELKVFSSFDMLLLMECHEDYYRNKVFSDFFGKYKITSFPLLNKPRSLSITKRNDILIIYAGSVLLSLRNPSFSCELLYRLSQQLDLNVLFFGSGDAVGIVKSYEESTNGIIQHLGMQDHDYVESRILEASVLLSIGNKESPMMPSKIYEYMSTGKPIVHVYTYEKDPCLYPLHKYGNAMIIKEGDYSCLDQLANFVSSHHDLDYEQIEMMFMTSTPKYSAKLLQSFANENTSH